MIKDKLRKILRELPKSKKACEAFMIGDYIDQEIRDELTIENIKYREVEQFGGEGNGDTYYRVYKFFDEGLTSNDEAFVEFNGFYSSYDGVDYHDWYFVEPREKTITVYEYWGT